MHVNMVILFYKMIGAVTFVLFLNSIQCESNDPNDNTLAYLIRNFTLRTSDPMNEINMNISLSESNIRITLSNLESVVLDTDPLKNNDERQNMLHSQLIGDQSSLGGNHTYNSCELNSSDNCQESLPHAPKFENRTLIKGLVLSVIAILSFLGNVATLSSILRAGRQGTSTVYMLLLQLAIADLLVTLFCILTEGLWTLTVEWLGGNILCKVVKFLQMFSLYLSTFLLVLIGFDRLCAVRFPMKRVHAKHHIRRGIISVWVLSAIFSSPQLAIFSVMRGPFVEEFYQCVTYAFYTALWQEQLYTTLTLVLMFLLPLFILITTYITTFITIARHQKMFSERVSKSAIDDTRYKILQKAKVKSLMITVVIVLTFVVCWTPYYVMMIIFMFLEPDEQLSQDLQSAIFFFGSSTAMLNPLIYGAFHLRRRKKSRSKSSSFANYSTTTRVDNSFRTTFRRSHIVRRSYEEPINIQTNGHLSAPCTSQHKGHRYSVHFRRIDSTKSTSAMTTAF